PSLSVSDILERYQDASKDFLVSVLNAKAKEDERKAEEERYKTEQIKLQAKQLELELALEKRRGSPPAARPYPTSTEPSTGHYSSSNSYYGASYHPYSSSEASRSYATNGKHSTHDHVAHSQQEQQEQQEHSQSAHPASQYSHQDQHAMHPSPQGRPPFLKINTSVRQYHPQPQSSQRLPPSPHSTLPPLPSTNPPKSSGRHYGLPPMNSSAQSSPVAVIDYQSHIPPPLTPKDEHTSPTSALSPTYNPNMKRKSVNHDAVMDAVRAKVLRNAAGQSQQHQHQSKKVATESDRDHSARRKAYQEKGSPDALRRPSDFSASSAMNAEQRQEERQVKAEVQPSSSSPNSPPTGHAEIATTESGSSSPPSLSAAKARRQSIKVQSSNAVGTVSEAQDE
ncbi:hypothetical protein BGZ98_008051, partial [Dissophora globulifera]